MTALTAECADVRRRTNDSEIDRGIDVGSTQCQAMFLEGGLDDPECLRSDAVQLGQLLRGAPASCRNAV
jgi:hypothetical protein